MDCRLSPVNLLLTQIMFKRFETVVMSFVFTSSETITSNRNYRIKFVSLRLSPIYNTCNALPPRFIVPVVTFVFARPISIRHSTCFALHHCAIGQNNCRTTECQMIQDHLCSDTFQLYSNSVFGCICKFSHYPFIIVSVNRFIVIDGQKRWIDAQRCGEVHVPHAIPLQ